MKRQKVSSSNLRSVGYDKAARILEIEFQSGTVYRYYDVPAGVYEELTRAPSPGRYFLANVREVYRNARAA
jgi:hypothetical protein